MALLDTVEDPTRAGKALGICGPNSIAPSPVPSHVRGRALNLHHAATDIYLWQLWRRDRGLSRQEVERVMCDLLIPVDLRKEETTSAPVGMDQTRELHGNILIFASPRRSHVPSQPASTSAR
ncbi:hypothetical protein EDD27_3944 [Nonomuraea polychroma]|uniref:Uncharacterized protein n=1 Tax=Nonomuraea polychroma TaxID=46176 RepID=A0A438M6S4_9ACTN|nr:hypothetical protein EDD27_3944 [Nonomuraea polychroma]